MAENHALQEPGLRVFARRALVLLAIAGGLVLAGFLGAAFIPRWWAHRLGDQVGGSIGIGIVLGLFYGFVFTALPIFVLWRSLRKRRSWKVWFWLLGVAVLFALPNLFTLGIVLGSGSGAHAGERTLDVEAPAFRNACLAGAIVAVLGGCLVAYLRISGRRLRGRVRRLESELRESRTAAPAQAETRDPESTDP